MNPLTEPGMEPTETRGPAVPPPAASPEPLDGGTRPGEPASAAGPAENEPSAGTASREEQPAESVVMIEPLPRSVASRRAADLARAVARRASNVVRGTATLALRYKLETIAVLLLGVGGAVYPPVWVLGVFVALPSRTWDLRDKWAGLVAPVLLVIAGTALIVVIGGKQDSLGSYVFEAWVGAGRVSRAAAVLGAGYLAWRLRHGRRVPKQAPWTSPNQLG